MTYFKKNKNAYRLLLIFFLIAHGYYYGNDPFNNLYLTFIYFSTFIFVILVSLIINIIRKFFRYTSNIFIRDDIEGAYSRSVQFSYKLNKILYFSNWWIIILTYLVIYPFAVNLNLGAFCTFLAFFYLVIDFVIRQLSLNWMWKNMTDSWWKFSSYDQFIFVFKHLLLAPLIIFLLFHFDFQLYNIERDLFTAKSSILRDKGWGWYIFSAFGFIFTFSLLMLLYDSVKKPEESWRVTFNLIYDD